MATMKDIARIAGVSTSTVSHAINGTRFVSDEIKAKIMAVVNELNYQPSAVARGLKSKHTGTLGMLVTTSDNPFFAEMLACVESACSERGYNLMLCNTKGDPKRLERSLAMFVQKRVDGLLLMCTEPQNIALPSLPLPVVVIDWWAEPIPADTVYEDSYLGGRLAAQALTAAGHRKVAIICGDLEKHLARQRLQGFLDYLGEAGIFVPKMWIRHSHFNFEGGVSAMQALLALPERPTAIFACSDTIAVGAYQVAQQAGLAIPQDLSIIGYDDIQLARFLFPPLSTIHQPKQALANLAVTALLKRIQTPDDPIQTLTVAPHFVARGSIAPPKP